MSTMIFVNVPVADLKASMAYYKAQGFDHNPQFTDDTAACIIISDTIYVMVLTHEKFAQFSSKPIPDARSQTGALYALSRDSREAVDAIADAGIKAGGTETRDAMDYGFMYSRAVADIDGHTWEYVWMDMSQMPTE
ncbi:MAG: lactoylglutathione lyase [Candidatus Devosia phytovorans]|uniref:Lactoylglutathione lyase n=1 Tax=Candidatus Devosia phytovorans TaxID=3121372 RepID=A0AAJ6AZ27_9HYPH|nr:lactoylglutathione lyase [Devosia sp.]WEK04160.1 MAG: lactoylglutathione lyase [Devosia sp.]